MYHKILEAYHRIQPFILETPVIKSNELSSLIEGEVFLKLENEQYTGSFKARGSINKILSLTSEEINQGTVTASTGNHGLGYARACEIADVDGCIYLPTNVSPSKYRALSNYRVSLKKYSTNCLETELYAKNIAKQNNKVWISPYNDRQVIAGQGTVGLEISKQVVDFDAVLVTIGGGGLISGIGSYMKEMKPKVEVIGCEPENSCEMTLSLEAGEIIDMAEELETLSGASAGGIERGAITFQICQKVVDDTLLVNEKAIAHAIRFIAHNHYKVIEGAAGVAVASLIENKERFKGKKVVVVICGGNMDMKKFKEII